MSINYRESGKNDVLEKAVKLLADQAFADIAAAYQSVSFISSMGPLEFSGLVTQHMVNSLLSVAKERGDDLLIQAMLEGILNHVEKLQGE